MDQDAITPKLDYLVMCDAVGVGPDGRKTLYGVFDRLRFMRFPVIYPHCCIVTRWAYGTGDHTLRVRLLDSDGKAIFDPKTDLKFNLRDPLVSAEIVLTLQGMRIPHPGTYSIECILDGQPDQEQKYIRFEVVKPPPAMPAQE